MKLAVTNEPIPRVASFLPPPEAPRSVKPEEELSRPVLGVKTSLASIIARVVEHHHAHTRSELRRLRTIGATLCGADVTLSGVRGVLALLTQLEPELCAHMTKEEAVIFPYIGSLEARLLAGRSLVRSPFGVLELPLKVMLNEQCETRSLLESMRNVSTGYTPPCGASPALVTFYQGLEALERDLSEHGRLETEVLFPCALELEQRAHG